MCLHQPNGCCPEEDAVNEREKLERAIKRLEQRKWCDDAETALAAARKHLATLPEAPRWVVNTGGVDRTFPTRGDAENEAHRQIKRGASTVSIRVI